MTGAAVDLVREADEADAICDEVNQLAMLFGDPERFHLVKDGAARRLRRLAKRLRGDTEAGPRTHVWVKPGSPPLIARRPSPLKTRRPG